MGRSESLRYPSLPRSYFPGPLHLDPGPRQYRVEIISLAPPHPGNKSASTAAKSLDGHLREKTQWSPSPATRSSRRRPPRSRILKGCSAACRARSRSGPGVQWLLSGAWLSRSAQESTGGQSGGRSTGRRAGLDCARGAAEEGGLRARHG